MAIEFLPQQNQTVSYRSPRPIGMVDITPKQQTAPPPAAPPPAFDYEGERKKLEDQLRKESQQKIQSELQKRLQSGMSEQLDKVYEQQVARGTKTIEQRYADQRKRQIAEQAAFGGTGAPINATDRARESDVSNLVASAGQSRAEQEAALLKYLDEGGRAERGLNLQEEQLIAQKEQFLKTIDQEDKRLAQQEAQFVRQIELEGRKLTQQDRQFLEQLTVMRQELDLKRALGQGAIERAEANMRSLDDARKPGIIDYLNIGTYF